MVKSKGFSPTSSGLDLQRRLWTLSVALGGSDSQARWAIQCGRILPRCGCDCTCPDVLQYATSGNPGADDAADKFRLQDYVRWRYLTTVSAALVIGIISISGVLPLQVSIALGGMIAVKGAESIADVLYGAFQRAERMDISSRARIYAVVLAAIAFTAIFWSTHNLLLALLVMSASLVVVLLFFTVPRLKVIDVRVITVTCSQVGSGDILRRTFSSYQFPLALPWLSSRQMPPFLVLRWDGLNLSLSTLYAGLAQLIVAGTMVVGAAGQAVTPRLARHAGRPRLLGIQSAFDTTCYCRVHARVNRCSLCCHTRRESADAFVYSRVWSIHPGARRSRDLRWIHLCCVFSGVRIDRIARHRAASHYGSCRRRCHLDGPIVTVPLWGLMGACFSVLLGSLTQFLTSQHLVRAVANE